MCSTDFVHIAIAKKHVQTLFYVFILHILVANTLFSQKLQITIRYSINYNILVLKNLNANFCKSSECYMSTVFALGRKNWLSVTATQFPSWLAVTWNWSTSYDDFYCCNFSRKTRSCISGNCNVECKLYIYLLIFDTLCIQKTSWKLKIFLANRIRILDTRMDEWMTAFLIHCHPPWYWVFLSNNFWFSCIAHRCYTCGILSHNGGQFASHFAMQYRLLQTLRQWQKVSDNEV